MNVLGKLANQAVTNLAQGQQQPQQQQPQQQQSQSKTDSLLNKLHGLAGGGPESEKKEDALDKGTPFPPLPIAMGDTDGLTFPPCTGIDWVQEHILKQGPQNNESAAEQAKDKVIADVIRDGFHKATGKPFPIKEKEEQKPSATSVVSGLAGAFLGGKK
mgnify:CR=1 FL=1